MAPRVANGVPGKKLMITSKIHSITKSLKLHASTKDGEDLVINITFRTGWSAQAYACVKEEKGQNCRKILRSYCAKSPLRLLNMREGGGR